MGGCLQKINFEIIRYDMIYKYEQPRIYMMNNISAASGVNYIIFQKLSNYYFIVQQASITPNNVTLCLIRTYYVSFSHMVS